jgi:NAD(P)-dependent dehydrogenase (short-subunit alcohol dehydrogenase family)
MRKVYFIAGPAVAWALTSCVHAVVATARDVQAFTSALRAADHLLGLRLDVTSPEDAASAAEAFVAHFGRIDVLSNNAGNFFAG